MESITRRSAVSLSLAAAAAASVAHEANAQGTGGASPYKDTQRGPGVIQRDYGRREKLLFPVLRASVCAI